MSDANREPEPSFGPDEEGDVPPPSDARPIDDPAAWVHADGAGHTARGAPTDATHAAHGDGTLQGSIPAGLTPDQMKEAADVEAGNDGGAG